VTRQLFLHSSFECEDRFLVIGIEKD
jgi:hypothetical protein